jgi:MFS family permease
MRRCTELALNRIYIFLCVRTCLLFSTLFTTGMGFISAFSPNYLSLMALRFLVGIGVGGGQVFSSWFLEFVPAPNRGTWMVVTVLEVSLACVSDCYTLYFCTSGSYLYFHKNMKYC